MRNLRVALAAACSVVVGWAFTASADRSSFRRGGSPLMRLRQSSRVEPRVAAAVALRSGASWASGYRPLSLRVLGRVWHTLRQNAKPLKDGMTLTVPQVRVDDASVCETAKILFDAVDYSLRITSQGILAEPKN